MKSPELRSVDDLWEAYYPRLKALVSRKVAGIRRPLISDSEVALSAFNSLVQRMHDGSFDSLASEEELWKLLKHFAKFKANDHVKRALAEKRRAELNAIGQADASTVQNDGLPRSVETASQVNSPSLETEVSDLFTHLLAKLPDDLHRDAVLLKLQGATTATIAECFHLSLRSAQLLVKRIEDAWKAELSN